MSRGTRRVRTRARGDQRAATTIDGNLLDARSKLSSAVHDLTARRAGFFAGAARWGPCRYVLLREALYGARGGSGHRSQPSSLVPCWVDALKLLMAIDERVAELERCHPPRCAGCPVWGHLTVHHCDHPTVRRVRALLEYRWRPQDARDVIDVAAELAGYASAIDDLFAPKPIYLDNECPQCGQSCTYRFTDDGQRVRTAALAVTAEHGAVCQSCHAVWPPDQLVFLGRILGTAPAGIPA